MLGRRDHATEDLRRKLLVKGYDRAVVGELIQRLQTERLVDDCRYVENFIGFRAARGQGPLRVRAELCKAGVASELVEAGIEAYDGWLVQLRNAREKKFGARLPTDYADRQRQIQFLSYRGFTGTQIRLALGFDTDTDFDT